MKYLLDTNILSELVRHPHGKIAQRIRSVGESQVGTSIIIAAELRFGAEKSGSYRIRQHVDAILGAITILPLELPSDAHYARQRHRLERAGTPIGPNDLLIAAQALALQLVVVTANLREFERVEGLQIENWLTQ